MANFMDAENLQRYDSKLKVRISNGYYNKDEIDILLAGVGSGIEWKESVETYADIAATYPYPHIGWTVTVNDTGITYRYDGASWVAIMTARTPIATEEVDGLMRKEYVYQLNHIGTASNKNFTTAVDTSTNLPTANAVNAFVNNVVAQMSINLEDEIRTKANADDLGDSSEKDYTDIIPEQEEKIEVKGEFFSTSTTSFFLKGNGVGDGIDLSFVEPINNYTLHMGLENYQSAVFPRLHVSGTKNGEPLDQYFVEGNVISIDDIPDECLAGTDSGDFEVIIDDYAPLDDFVELNLLIYPVLHDESNNSDIALINNSAYENTIIHQEYDYEANNHILYGNYGLFSSADLPTSSAVSVFVKNVADALRQILEAHIDEVEAKVDAYEEASDEDIEALFGGNHEATDEDIENLFG